MLFHLLSPLSHDKSSEAIIHYSLGLNNILLIKLLIEVVSLELTPIAQAVLPQD